MKGANTLLAKINEALTQLQNDGTLADLQVQYLGIEPEDVVIPPTPTPAPPQPTQKPPECLDNAAWLEDLSYDDKRMTEPPVLNPGEPFTKGWRLRNSGTCTWKNGSYKLVFSYGNVAAAQMGGQPIPVTKDVKPGETFDFYVNLVAPVKSGAYEGYWNMRNAYNTKFGETVWVYIVVADAPTPTPPPTDTPAPNVAFTADPTTITAGQSVLFRWDTQSAKYVYFYHDGQKWSEHPVEDDGKATEYPPYTMNYNLHVVHKDGSIVDRTILITVNPAPDKAPVIEYLSATPSQIMLGETVSIDWKVSGQVHQAMLYIDDVAVLDPAPVQGNYMDTPQVAGTRVYKLVATGPGGDDTEQVSVNVQMAEPIEPIPQPVIQGFDVSPTTIEQGQSVTVSWTTGGGTTYLELLRNDEMIWMDTQLNNSVTDAPPAEAGTTIRYVLVAYNNAGDTMTGEAIVRVAETPPQNLLANSNWQLQSMQGAGDVPGEVSITAYFSADGSLSGNGGCNAYSASYASNGQEILINTPSGGGQSCGEPFDSLEQAFLGLLPQTANFLANGKLVLLNNTGQETLSFNRIG